MTITQSDSQCIQVLNRILSGDLDFASKSANNPLHNFHSFPAKFPPELPRTFILQLTSASETVLDPMLGSGTTILEAYLANRRAIGFDIDPLALLMSRVKTSAPNADALCEHGSKVLAAAKEALASGKESLEHDLQVRWDPRTKAFIDYWFLPDTQLELLALLRETERVTDMDAKDFLALTLSSIIITKSGGVSLAMDLGHTRPHRVAVVVEGMKGVQSGRGKRLRSAVRDFEKRFRANLNALRMRPHLGGSQPQIHYGYAQELPLRDDSVDLIVTSPPYAANAIDYMRAHKFSLVWLGYSIDDLTRQKSEYIGNRRLKDATESLPPLSESIVADLAQEDQKKSEMLRSYFVDMKSAIGEMVRVLKPGKTAVVVVGNSVLRGKNTRTAECLAEIGESLGFLVVGMRLRAIDRNHRMMPVSTQVDLKSLVQQRMHQEYVIGLCKPC